MVPSPLDGPGPPVFFLSKNKVFLFWAICVSWGSLGFDRHNAEFGV